VRTKTSVALLLAVSSGLTVVAGQERPTFRSSVDLVPIGVVVRDGRNRLVTGLTAEDFQVLDNGVRCRIVDFQRDQTTPLTLALLDGDDVSAAAIAELASRNKSFDFLNDAREDVYTESDCEAL